MTGNCVLHKPQRKPWRIYSWINTIVIVHNVSLAIWSQKKTWVPYNVEKGGIKWSHYGLTQHNIHIRTLFYGFNVLFYRSFMSSYIYLNYIVITSWMCFIDFKVKYYQRDCFVHLCGQNDSLMWVIDLHLIHTL